MEILALFTVLLGFLCICAMSSTHSIPKYNYELIGTFTYKYNYIWDKEGSGYRTDMVAIFEDTENHSRKYEGSVLYANEWLRSWERYDITTEQLIDFLKDYGIDFKKNKNRKTDSVIVKPITEDDCKLYYGHCYYYKNYTYFDDDTNYFKMKASDELDDNTYAELNFEDLLFIRIYKDGKYYSTDRKNWKKIEGKSYTREGQYLTISDDLYKLFNEMEEAKYPTCA